MKNWDLTVNKLQRKIRESQVLYDNMEESIKIKKEYKDYFILYIVNVVGFRKCFGGKTTAFECFLHLIRKEGILINITNVSTYQLNMSFFTVSEALKKLENLNIVQMYKVGRKKYIFFDKEFVKEVYKYYGIENGQQ